MITKQLLRDWGACWPDDRIDCFANGRTSLSPREIINDKSIDLDDRLWVACRSIWYLDERAARLFAIECALSVAHLAGDEDDEAQFRGLMNDLIAAEDHAAWAAARDAAWDAAWAAAWDAAWAAARDAARAATRDAAWAAARDAARAAARDAAWDSAWDAAWDAARDADIEKSIARALEWLGDYSEGWEEDEIEERRAA